MHDFMHLLFAYFMQIRLNIKFILYFSMYFCVMQSKFGSEM